MDHKNKIHCSFCGKAQDEVRRIAEANLDAEKKN